MKNGKKLLIEVKEHGLYTIIANFGQSLEPMVLTVTGSNALFNQL